MVCQHAYSCEYEAHGEKRGSKLTAAALEPAFATRCDLNAQPDARVIDVAARLELDIVAARLECLEEEHPVHFSMSAFSRSTSRCAATTSTN